MHDAVSPGFTFALALFAGVSAIVAARWLRVPSILPLLATGVLLGADGLGWLDPGRLGEGLAEIVGLAVAIILFEGGMSLEIGRLQRAARPIRRLVTVGAAVTFAGAAVAAHLAMGWSWPLSVLFGSLVIVTGPTVIRPILRNVPLRPRLATVLEAEGVLIDAVGAIVAGVALQSLVGQGGAPLADGTSGLLARIALGALVGFGGGFVLAWLLRGSRTIPQDLENIATLAAALLLFQLAEALYSESGILAVVLAGVVVGNVQTKLARQLLHFAEQLTLAFIGVVFVLLAADVRLADVAALGWRGALVVALLVLVVRPLCVLVATAASNLGWRERTFLALVAPRGIVAAAVASLFAAYMEQAGFPGGTALRALVFLTIVATVVAGGVGAPLLASLLDLRAPAREGVAILGAEALGLALGDLLRQGGTPVTFLDTNPHHCRAAEEAGFTAVLGNALDPNTLARARLDRVTAAIGLTANGEVNSLFAREAAAELDVPATFVAQAPGRAGVPPEMLARQGSRVAFDGPKDVEGWNVRLRHGRARLEQRVHDGTATPAAPRAGAGAGSDPGGADPSDAFVVLAIRVGDAWRIFSDGDAPREGDVVTVAIATGQIEAADAALAAMGWRRPA